MGERRRWLWGMVLVLLIAAALRLLAFGEVPPGLYHDETFHGLDALDVLQGRHSAYFAANNGREPMFIYLVTLGVGLFGQSPFALRLGAAFAGILTVAATAAMGRALFSRRVGLLGAAVLAVTLWHVHLSRVGFRAVLLPLFIALTAWQTARGVRTGRYRHWLAAGVLYGLGFYTYMASRFTPVALAALGLYALVVHRGARERWPWRGIIIAAASAAAVVAPLAITTAVHPEIVLGRPGQVSVFNPLIHGGDLWGTLGAHVLRTLGMFFVQGDRIYRHNVPWRPIFDPLLGGAFLLGLLAGLRRMRREVAASFVVVWTAVMVLPTLLAEDAPHFLRSAGVLPVVAFLPALGLDWLTRWGGGNAVARPRRLKIGWLLVAAVLLFALGSTICAYFGDYARDPSTGYWFESGAVALAGHVNRFLGTGWDGTRMLPASPDGAGTERHVYLDPVLWDQWPQVRFLVTDAQRVTVGLEESADAGAAAVFVWPYGEWQRAWQLLPHPAEITVEEGPLSQGDRDPEPTLTYLSFTATPYGGTIPPLARFSEGVELVGVAVVRVAQDQLQVRLRWRAAAPLEQDYTVFLHYLRDGELVAQGDGQPARGRYPTTLWQAGDVINDDHGVAGTGAPIPGRDTLLVGLWHPETGAALHVLDEAGNPAGDWIVVPVEE